MLQEIMFIKTNHSLIWFTAMKVCSNVNAVCNDRSDCNVLWREQIMIIPRPPPTRGVDPAGLLCVQSDPAIITVKFNNIQQEKSNVCSLLDIKV